jgi:DNA-binding response OmpR family regulator
VPGSANEPADTFSRKHGITVKNVSDQIEGIPLLVIAEIQSNNHPDPSYLESWGFRVDLQENLSLALRQLDEEDYSGIILDLWFSGDGGLEALMRIRPIFAQPIFVFASRFEPTDRLMAYEMGADDFLTNELSPREFVTRVRAGIKRRGNHEARSDTSDTLISVQDLQLNTRSRTAFRAGNRLTLTRVEFEILAALMRRPGCVFTREILLESTAQDPYAVLDRTVDVHITALRRKLQDSAHNPKYIHTIRGVGYSLLESSAGRTS